MFFVEKKRHCILVVVFGDGFFAVSLVFVANVVPLAALQRTHRLEEVGGTLRSRGATGPAEPRHQAGEAAEVET